MSPEKEYTPDLDSVRESAEFVTDSAFQLLRLNLILIGIYLTVGGYITNLNPAIEQDIWTSNYIIASAILLLMSIVAGYITYESTGRIASIFMYDEPERVYQKYSSTERLVFNLRYTVLLTLLSGLTFGFGVLDGVAPNGFTLLDAWQFVFALVVLTTLPIVLAHYGIQISKRLSAYWPSD